MFDIIVENTSVYIYEELALPGKIIINDFKENFTLPISYWSLDDYKKSWSNSIKQGIENKNHAALPVSMYDLSHANFIFLWTLYFENNIVHAQNSMFFLDEHPGFKIENINQFISPRETHDDEGTKISEWDTDLASVIKFYTNLISG